MIECRIKNFFDNIDINTLVHIIKDKIKTDRTIMGILHKLIKAGYMEYYNFYPSYRDSAAGDRLSPLKASYQKLGILTPILLNIYLTSLDEFINKLQENYVRDHHPELRGRIYYVRYGDEWVIGVVGSFQLAKKIKEDIRTYLWEELKLELSPDNSNITHLGREYAKFLGHYVGWPSHDGRLSRGVAVAASSTPLIFYKNLSECGGRRITEFAMQIRRFYDPHTKMTNFYKKFTLPSLYTPLMEQDIVRGRQAFFRIIRKKKGGLGVNSLESVCHPSFEVSFSPSIFIPLSELKSKLVESGFADTRGHPKYMGKFIYLPDYEIVKKYNRVLIKIIAFYNTADNRSGLRELIYILEYSLAHTLAAKHRSTLAKIFSKYSKPIRVMRYSQKITFAKPSSLSVKYLDKNFGYLRGRVLANTEGVSIAHLLSYIFDYNR